MSLWALFVYTAYESRSFVICFMNYVISLLTLSLKLDITSWFDCILSSLTASSPWNLYNSLCIWFSRSLFLSKRSLKPSLVALCYRLSMLTLSCKSFNFCVKLGIAWSSRIVSLSYLLISSWFWSISSYCLSTLFTSC